MSMILDAFVGSFVERLVRFVEEKAATVLGVKEELKRLQRTLLRIENVLVDAERRSMEDLAINNWVKELKDVMYDAEDIMDLCMHKDAQLLLDRDQTSSSSSNPPLPRVRCFSFISCFTTVPDRYVIGQRIKSLNDRLDEIDKDRAQFNFHRGANQPRVTTVNRHQNSPVEAELDIVGKEIENATQNLVKLMTEYEGEVNRCRVFAITGMGGIGKSTLAGKIFNHWKVQTRFQIKAWISISQTYNEIELLKELIRAVQASYGEAMTRAELVPILKSAVSEKSLFLVLDDVWRADVWIDFLRFPLQSAQSGSLILITCRDENVARQIGSLHIHPVKLLPVETGWEMLTRRLVTIARKDQEEVFNLKEIGIQIIKKCSGLPLAIKVMAGVLAQKDPNAIEWKKVLNHNAWSTGRLHEDLRGALYLSYDDMPSCLKQCFLYCSLFPEDNIIMREELVGMWIAEGLIKDEAGSLMEDKANEYYDELIQRNLLQLAPYQPIETNVYCKMHDMIRSLAQIISGDGNFRENLEDRTNISLCKFRRLSITSNTNIVGILDAITQPRSLRTLYIFSRPDILGNLGRFLHLRVLILQSRNIKIIPNEIGDLFYLRYLRLNLVNVQILPESIGGLSNLQFLILGDCPNLRQLPQSITMLKNLRSLSIPRLELAFIPKGIESLKQLNLLKGFFVRDDSVTSQVGGEQTIMHSTMTELSSLVNLRILHLFKLERVRPGFLVLAKLSQLKDLQLSFSYKGLLHMDQITEKDMSLSQNLFEELTLPRFIEKFSIILYHGHSYPKWIMSKSLGSHFPYLSTIKLSYNQKCPVLPPLGQLPNLRTLDIEGAQAVTHIGPEFFGCGVISSISETRTAFPMLQQLVISHMMNLEEWFFSEGKEDNDDFQKLILFPRLHNLRLCYCPKLKALPSGFERITLKSLTIIDTSSLKEVVNLPRVTDVNLTRNHGLERISNLPALKLLSVDTCLSLTCVECLNGLQQLNLCDFKMNGLPRWLLKLAKVWGRRCKNLTVEDDFYLELRCKRIVLRECKPGGRYWPFIQQFQRVNAYINSGECYLCFVKQPFSNETSTRG